MKAAQFCWLASMVYTSPRISESLAIALAVLWVALAIYAEWKKL